MKDWFVPPIVIPFVLIVTVVAYALFRMLFSQRHQKYSQRCPSPLVAVRPFTMFVVSTAQPTHVCAVRLRGLARHLLACIEYRVWFPFRSEL